METCITWLTNGHEACIMNDDDDENYDDENGDDGNYEDDNDEAGHSLRYILEVSYFCLSKKTKEKKQLKNGTKDGQVSVSACK